MSYWQEALERLAKRLSKRRIPNMEIYRENYKARRAAR